MLTLADCCCVIVTELKALGTLEPQHQDHKLVPTHNYLNFLKLIVPGIQVEAGSHGHPQVVGILAE